MLALRTEAASRALELSVRVCTFRFRATSVSARLSASVGLLSAMKGLGLPGWIQML